MKRRTKNAERRAARRRADKERTMKNPGGKSRYALKREYCLKNGLWGFEVLEPKPWKGAMG